ncbi:carbon-nitrogen hydrolase family protein [Solirubrobacter phytolaccae]|uniref:Carbon-nitrogen hydrolase family protein n=1 Tax=Solirubrobacter phytolaccae TaxID=1404360 RepID=A0A9X3SAV2_9ACTN|nr:carbon-nitrogen hydrolase family protein [Solirubrobacter phytolaccae]MDA0184849.1 carbon-nitrogen hydrolase family protein [Solirubrobacter phytolaccae]
MSVRVAAVEAEAVPGAVAKNVETATRLTRAAAEQGAELVVFPEAFVTGYDDGVFGGELPTLDDLGWLDPLQRAVDEGDVVVVLNTALDRGERRTLTDFVLRAGSAPWPAYDKQHIYATEREHFTPGEDGASFTLKGFEFALSVCYDANFPEHAAGAAADGASVYLASGAYFPGGERRRDLHYGARALDNGLYVVFAGLLGAPHAFIGGSAVYDPLGTRIAHAVDGLAIADLDPEAITAARRSQQMWADRRAHLGSRTVLAFE